MGPWELVAEIASGAMGTVYLARGRGANRARVAAVKRLHPHLESEMAFVRMFMDEARLARRIASRHVVETYELLEDAGHHAIAMRYVEGGSLAALARAHWIRNVALPPAIGLRIVHDTLLGLDAAHEAKGETGERLDIVHRDVSPQNVLVDLDGYSQLTDFGVARARGRLHSTYGQQVKGKLRYLAPEQLRDARVDRRADIFSAGIVLWELLVGAQLFDGDDDVAIMRNVLIMAVPPPSARGARIPLAIDRLCLRALSRDPGRRYATAREFAQAIHATGMMAPREEVSQLVRAVFGDDTARCRKTLARPLRPSAGASAVWAALAALFLALLAAGAGAWLHFRHPPAPPDASTANPPAVKTRDLPASASATAPPLEPLSPPTATPPSSSATARHRDAAPRAPKPSSSTRATPGAYIPETL
ncbi:MAG TPA: protein kinase [Polyangiaceae bacterium]|nr:protein kinase [Polyangiaceae bacterium]